ncbi:bacteriocin [Enterococcus faecalis]|uniref:bacteriocin n=1 Tax=Streptococcus sp. TaxID=1306 RepID=UPI0019E25197|nr:bacteriocin [Streptococcus sp.]EGO6638272.1 bacteriocin [Enterococcus faecalis]EHQ8823929.1 bacteriocin [Enterococcus faecalis]EHR4134262.1 bacteriocin [Enterococcus faecalis]EIW2096834.1 bacteriocin [Enterococcus faecalis]EJR6112524.1 bacteriocin [Enterococcus faecalis]
MIKELNINELESIIGGGNVSNCLLSASGAFATIAGAGAVAGPIGLGVALISAAGSGFLTGYNCTALYHEGD